MLQCLSVIFIYLVDSFNVFISVGYVDTGSTNTRHTSTPAKEQRGHRLFCGLAELLKTTMFLKQFAFSLV